MAKQKKKTEEEDVPTIKKEIKTIDEPAQETYNLVELVTACPVSDTWIIYNLARTGLLSQYEYELEHYGKKELPTSLTVEQFDKIVNGEK